MALVEFSKDEYTTNKKDNSADNGFDPKSFILITLMTILIVIFSLYQIFNAVKADVPKEMRPHKNGLTAPPPRQ